MKIIPSDSRCTPKAAILALPLFLAACASQPLSTQEANAAQKARIAGDCPTAVAGLQKAYSDGRGQVTSSGISEAGEAASQIGAWYFMGTCVPQNRQLAIDWWTKANTEPGIKEVSDYVHCLDSVNSPRCPLGDNWQGRSPEDQAELERQAQAAMGSSYSAITAAILQAAAQGIEQGYANRSQNRAVQAYIPPAPVYSAQSSRSTGAVYDPALDQCVKIGGDGQSVYFENGCNVSLTIAFSQSAGMGVGMQDCDPSSRCTFGIFGIGYSSRNNTVIAVCPKGDYVAASPGVQWAGSGPFRCRRP